VWTIILVLTLTFVAVALVFLFSSHPFWHKGGEGFGFLLHSQGHWQFELFVSLIETIVLDVVILYIGWQKLVKPHIHKDVADARKAMEEHFEDDMDSLDEEQGRHQ
jgi:hypothetical protein